MRALNTLTLHSCEGVGACLEVLELGTDRVRELLVRLGTLLVRIALNTVIGSVKFFLAGN